MINKDNIVSVTKVYLDGSYTNRMKVIFNTDKVAFVGDSNENKDYQTIQEWIADGGTVIDNGGGE